MFLTLLWDRPKKIRLSGFSQLPTDYHPQHNCHLVHVPYLPPALSILACFWWHDRAWKIVRVALFCSKRAYIFHSSHHPSLPQCTIWHNNTDAFIVNGADVQGLNHLASDRSSIWFVVGISENWRQNFVEVRRNPRTSLSCLNKLSFACRRAKCRDILINMHIKDNLKLKCKCLKAPQKL